MKKTLKIVLAALCLCISANLFAQSQKEHTVQAGETVSAIARKYNVKTNDIIKANPSLGNGNKILVGQKLIIPTTSAPTEATTTAVQTETPTKPVTVQPTTSAKNSTTKTEPVKVQPAQNSQPVATTQVQTTIPPTSQNPGYLNTGYKEMYRIQKKDNLYKIALKFNLTIEELLEANPGLTKDSKIKKDDFLFIPFSQAEKQAELSRLEAEKAAAEAEIAAAEKAAEEAAKASKRNTSKHMNVAVVLPFKESGDMGLKMIEFYRGLLMGADSVKHKGTSIDIYAYNSGSSLADIYEVTRKPEFKDMHLIIGTINTTQANVISQFCEENDIRFVMPFATTNTSGLNNKMVFHASVNADDAYKHSVELISKQFKDANYIILKTGYGDDRGAHLTTDLKTKLEAEGHTVKTLLLNASEAEYNLVMSKTQQNVLISDASSLSAANNMVRKLQTYKKKYATIKFCIVGYPEWPTYAGSLANDFYALDTYAYCTFFRNESDARITAFEHRYKEYFKQEMSRTYPRYGLFGFDLGYYFINGISMLGDSFEQKLPVVRYNNLQNGFRFTQKNEERAYENQHVILVHYTTDKKIEIIK